MPILIHDEAMLAAEKAKIHRSAVKQARQMGKWSCPGKCGRTISANASLCFSCSQKKEENDELV
jgi:hypothetical protein